MDMTRAEEDAILFEYEREEKGETKLEDDGRLGSSRSVPNGHRMQ